MKLGLESFSTRNSGMDPIGVLEYVSGLGLQGVLFEMAPFSSYRDEVLETIRHTAEEKGMYIEFGMGSIFHWHPMAEKGRQLLADAGHDVAVSEAEMIIKHLELAKKLGSPILRCVCGDLFSRDQGCDMVALADQAVAIFKEACKAAEDMGIKISVENHADFTVREMLSIAGRINSPAYGFTVDTGNLAFDLDDPLRLARMLAPLALTTHYKNYKIVRTHEGLALENCALGDGEIDVVEIAKILMEHNPEINMNIEIHSQWGPFPLAIFEPTFFEKHPSPPGEGMAWYLQKSWEKDIPESFFEGLPDGEASWELEQDHVKRSAEWMIKELGPLASK